MIDENHAIVSSAGAPLRLVHLRALRTCGRLVQSMRQLRSSCTLLPSCRSLFGCSLNPVGLNSSPLPTCSGARVLRGHHELCGQDAAGAWVHGAAAQQGKWWCWAGAEVQQQLLLAWCAAWAWVHAQRLEPGFTVLLPNKARARTSAQCSAGCRQLSAGSELSCLTACLAHLMQTNTCDTRAQGNHVVGILSDEADPAVSVMKVEHAPTESYADVGGLEQQVRAGRLGWRCYWPACSAGCWIGLRPGQSFVCRRGQPGAPGAALLPTKPHRAALHSLFGYSLLLVVCLHPLPGRRSRKSRRRWSCR